MKEFPTTLTELQKELLIHSKDGRSDDLFRIAIALAQFGAAASHLTHDPVLNPVARPYGTKESEKSDLGHMIVQVCTYAALRGVNIQEAVNMALLNLREKDFIKKTAPGSGDIRGITAHVGEVMGVALVDPFMSINKKPPAGTILVAANPYSDHRLTWFAAVVIDNGGYNCHAAIVAREKGIPCIVGTGNATREIRTGDLLHFDASKSYGNVIVVNHGN